MNSFDIPIKTILKVVGVLGLIAFLWAIRDIIAILFFAVIISSAVTPAVSRIEKVGIPRVVGALTVYLGFFGLLTAILSILVPPLAHELIGLVTNLKDNPMLFNGSQTITQMFSSLETFLRSLAGRLSADSSSVLAVFSGVLGGLSSVVFTLVISFYLTLEDNGIKGFLRSVIPAQQLGGVLDLINRTQRTLGRWLVGQFVLGVIVGSLVFIGLFLLGNPYALSLAILAGLFEIIPYLGPLLGAIPGILVTFSISQDLVATFITLAMYVLVQQVENHAIVPLVMRKALNIDPILILLVILIGGKIGGLAGAVLFVPLAALVAEYVRGSTGVELKLRSHRPAGPPGTKDT